MNEEDRIAGASIGGFLMGVSLGGPMGGLIGAFTGKVLAEEANKNGRKSMTTVRTFISFDFDHDEDLRNLLVGQSLHPDSPFSIIDRSIKEHLTGDWEAKVRGRIGNVDQVIIICGTHTHIARGVGIELKIARDQRKPYFFLQGRNGQQCNAPSGAFPTDKIYNWTWDNLKVLIAGGR
jgi:hypothetical protein